MPEARLLKRTLVKVKRPKEGWKKDAKRKKGDTKEMNNLKAWTAKDENIDRRTILYKAAILAFPSPCCPCFENRTFSGFPYLPVLISPDCLM